MQQNGVPPTAKGLFPAIMRRLPDLRTAARDDAREEAQCGEGGGREGELAQVGVVADDLEDVGEGADVGGEGYVGFLCAYSMNK
jgi:hypothetical protein